MRWAMLLAATAAACSADIATEASGDGDDDFDPAAPCLIDADCAVASSSCCSCPTFATGADGAVCGAEIECGPLDCAPTTAVCDEGVCRLSCVEVPATGACETGYEVDEAGCATDRCVDSPPECAADGECAKVPADCCGCELGGGETAVPIGEVDAHLAGLECADESACPGIDACDEAATVRCLGGTCRLVREAGIDTPLPVCGTAGGLECPEGEICVLNHPAAPPGVAICRQLSR